MRSDPEQHDPVAHFLYRGETYGLADVGVSRGSRPIVPRSTSSAIRPTNGKATFFRRLPHPSARAAACRAELIFNRRTAPELYLSGIIAGSGGARTARLASMATAKLWIGSWRCDASTNGPVRPFGGGRPINGRDNALARRGDRRLSPAGRDRALARAALTAWVTPSSRTTAICSSMTAILDREKIDPITQRGHRRAFLARRSSRSPPRPGGRCAVCTAICASPISVCSDGQPSDLV